MKNFLKKGKSNKRKADAGIIGVVILIAVVVVFIFAIKSNGNTMISETFSTAKSKTSTLIDSAR